MNGLSIFHRRFIRAMLAPLVATVVCGALALPPAFGQEEEEADLAEITNGERLFLETRFAQFFKAFLDDGGDVNNSTPARATQPSIKP